MSATYASRNFRAPISLKCALRSACDFDSSSTAVTLRELRKVSTKAIWVIIGTRNVLHQVSTYMVSGATEGCEASAKTRGRWILVDARFDKTRRLWTIDERRREDVFIQIGNCMGGRHVPRGKFRKWKRVTGMNATLFQPHLFLLPFLFPLSLPMFCSHETKQSSLTIGRTANARIICR